jgi:hypothetical protein
MTSNELHQVLLDSTFGELTDAIKHLKSCRDVLSKTEPPRRDSSGPDVASLNLKIYKASSQAKESAALLEEILRRTRLKEAT